MFDSGSKHSLDGGKQSKLKIKFIKEPKMNKKESIEVNAVELHDTSNESQDLDDSYLDSTQYLNRLLTLNAVEPKQSGLDSIFKLPALKQNVSRRKLENI